MIVAVTYPTLTACVTGAGFPVLVLEEENFHRGTKSVSHYGVLYRGTRPAPVFVEIRKNFYALDFPIDFYVPKEEFENSGSQPMSILFSRFNYSMRLFLPHVELKTLYNG